MLWIVAALAVPLPTFHGPSPWTGSPDLTVGTGIWQAPMRGGAWPHAFPRVNVNATLAGRIGRRGLLGLHGAWQYTRYGPDARVANPNGRLEPRVGLRYRLGSGFIDLTAGLSVDRGRGIFLPGPVLAVAPRIPLGKSRTYAVLEARLALRYGGGVTFIDCLEWCDQRWIDNPGGTGLLLGIGRPLSRSPADQRRRRKSSTPPTSAIHPAEPPELRQPEHAPPR
ncbi:MAG: hypothetical protein H6736_12790 [Alphaproteobacteria bacterium]|nr:hypothetical protein [Alphaproteobacteria bacterium]